MNDERKILITDSVHSLLIERLTQQNFSVNYQPNISESEVREIIHDYEGLIVNSKVYVGKEMLDKGLKLKFVCRLGSGLEVIDRIYATEKKIAVFNSPEGNRNAVAEHALAMLLGLMNNIYTANRQVKNMEWKREANRGTELSGKTVALIAFGNTAKAFSKLLSGFDVRLLAYDKYLDNSDFNNVELCGLDKIFLEADVLSIHLPLTDETKYMIDYAFLSQFKKPIWLINTSRGKVLRTSDLIKCLDEGKVLAAGLDVLENEKLDSYTEVEKNVFNELALRSNVALTPHIAGWTHESKLKIAEVLLENIAKLYSETIVKTD
jgi:D-3-phosphoglycerate dehydrogenase